MINFPFGTNGKLIILGVPILKHITVDTAHIASETTMLFYKKKKMTIFFFLCTLYKSPRKGGF